MGLSPSMKIIFFGLGSIGLRHARILIDSYKHQLFAYRSGNRPIIDERIKKSITEVSSNDEINEISPDIAFITNPTSMHLSTAIECAKAGQNLFIEKPLGINKQEIHNLMEIVNKKNISTYVAYNLRFHPIIEKLKEYVQNNQFLHMRVIRTSYLPSWRPREDHLNNYSSSVNMGGGVIYELSHEIDYIKYLLNEINIISGQYEKRSTITFDAEDYADFIIHTKIGPVNLHINFMSQIFQRRIEIDFPEFAVIADLTQNYIKEIRQGETHAHYEFKDANDRDFTYEKQIEYFFNNINNTNMMNNVIDAADITFKIIDFINQFHNK